MQIVSRYLVAETVKSQIAVFFVLMTIFVTQKFVRVLADASEGDIPASLVIGFLALKLPALATMIIPLSLFLGILISHGRFYVDSEMAVMQACGISEWYVTRVMLVMSLVVALIVSVFTLWLSPWAAQQEFDLKHQLVAESGLSSIIPGRFQKTANGNGVLFVQNQGLEKDQLRGVFVAMASGANQQASDIHLVYAQHGNVTKKADGSEQLQLRQGYQYTGTEDQLDFNIVEFKGYQVSIAERAVEKRALKLEAYTTLDLLDDDSLDAYAEFQWRIALPLSIPFLVLIAVPLSSVNPRQGRFGKLFPALLLYLGYSLLLMAGKKAIASGQLPASLGLWWVHALMFTIGAVLLSEERTFGIKLRAQLRGLRA